MNKSKVTIGPITLSVWNDYYGTPNRESPTRAKVNEIIETVGKDKVSMVTVPIALAIYQQAALKLIGYPLGAGSEADMRGKLHLHNQIINSKIPVGFDGLVAGHMKDLVLSELLHSLHDPKANIVIWGWSKGEGRGFWQNEFGGHYYGWADYSQGLRLVDRECFVLDSQGIKTTHDLHDLYKDSQYSRHLTTSGHPLSRVTYE